MLKVNYHQWNQNVEELREMALTAAHTRTRERLMALYEICLGKSATQVGKDSKRNPQTIMDWVHRYNMNGVDALKFQHTGGHLPVLSKDAISELDGLIREALAVATTPPQKRKQQTYQSRWTLKRLVKWLESKFGVSSCRETVRKALKSLGFSWKKARKLLNKANPKKRAKFLEKLESLLTQTLKTDRLLVYIDEAHIYLDTDEGYGWSIEGERFWVSSCSPGLKKVSFYGVYLYNLGQVRFFPYETANGLNSINLLEKIRAEFPNTEMTLIWDGAPYHRSGVVINAAADLQIDLQPLPAYSPDFMPVEHLWQWLREDITYHTCYEQQADLIAQVNQFELRINEKPNEIADRLWVTTHLKPKVEKLRVSS